MTNREWSPLAAILGKGWPGSPWDDAADAAYRTMLSPYEPGLVLAALHKLAAGSGHFRPSVGEIVGALGDDPGAPTFDEAFEAMYGRRGALRAQPPRAEGPVMFDSPSDGDRLVAQAVLDRAADCHPLVAAFVERNIDSLRREPVDDPEFAGPVRHRLQQSWSEFVAAWRTRGAHELALRATGRRGELGRLRPLAALGLESAGELGPGER